MVFPANPYAMALWAESAVLLVHMPASPGAELLMVSFASDLHLPTVGKYLRVVDREWLE